MGMSPEVFTAICAGITLFIYFTGTIIGMVVALFKKIDRTKFEIMKDVNSKHNENKAKYDALSALVIRHETILHPEFPGPNGKHHPRGR